MLVLTRKKNESIIIGDAIKIVVVEIRSDKVRLGIEAPNKVPVHRQEVYEAIKRDLAKQNARAGFPADVPVVQAGSGDKAGDSG